MTGFEYPYLAGAALLCLIFGALLAGARRQRRAALLSGLCSVPCSFSSLLFVPEYWDPVRLFGLRVGIEDLLFSFATGGIVWILAALGANAPAPKLRSKAIAIRYLAVAALGTVTAVLMQWIGGPIMVQAIAGMALVGVVLVWPRLAWLSRALRAGAAFGAGYTLLTAAWFSAFPRFPNQWTQANLSGRLLLSVPVEETLWAFTFGTSWAIVMFFVLSVPMRR